MRTRNLALVAVLAVLIGWARCSGPGEAELTAPVPPSAPARPPAPTTPEPPEGPAATAAAAAARAAVQAWQAPTAEERQARLALLVTPAYLTASASIDPAAVPTAPVAGAGDVRADDDGGASVTVTLTDGTALAVDLTTGPAAGAWRVHDIRPAL